MREYQERAQAEMKGRLDLSYYHLGNDGLNAILPVLSDQYLLNIKYLNLSYNSVNDAGLDGIIQEMASLCSPIEELDLSGNHISDGQVKLLADFIKQGKLKYLGKVGVTNCPKITEDGHRVLKLATRRAQSNKGDPKLNKMYAAAAARDKEAFK